MLNNYKYYKTESCIHKLNPLCKILISIIFIVMVLLTFSIKSVLALFLVLSFIIGLSNIPYKKIFNPIWSIKYIILIIFLVSLPFGINNSIILILKICLITIYYSILIMSTKVNELIKGFYSLYKPLKIFGIEIDRLSIDSALFLNFIPFYIREYKTTKIKLLSRGFENSFKNAIYKNINLISITYKNILKKRDIMLIRGITFDKNNFVWHLSDVYIVMCHIVVLVLVLVKEVVV